VALSRSQLVDSEKTLVGSHAMTATQQITWLRTIIIIVVVVVWYFLKVLLWVIEKGLRMTHVLSAT
jgi:ABC-type Mn2+/Zn2+ transport system permease subunit